MIRVYYLMFLIEATFMHTVFLLNMFRIRMLEHELELCAVFCRVLREVDLQEPQELSQAPQVTFTNHS